MKKIIIINGPNLNLLGKRQVEIYGSVSFEDYFSKLTLRYSETIELQYFQSNHEGNIIDEIHRLGFSYDGIIINAGAYTHTSIAIADALASVTAPAIEVHISNIYEREPYRHISYIKEVAVHQIVGQGLKGYDEALQHFINEIYS